MQANAELYLALSKGNWSVDEATAIKLQDVADRVLAGESQSLFQVQAKPLDAELKKSMHVATFAAATTASGPRPVRMSWYTDLDKVEPGSLAVIGVQGIITKSAYWGMGSMERAERILEAANHPNIAGIILDIDTPGGQVDGLGTTNDAILYARQIKPVIGVINDGNCYSAGYHLLSACTEAWATHKTCRVGSIGTMCTFTDASEADKKNGYKRIVVYATLSTEKNATYRKALAGDTSGITAELDILNADFQGRILKTRRDKIKNPAGVFNGRTLSATEGVKEGLLDTIGSMQLAMARCAELAKVAPPALPADESDDDDNLDDDDEAPTASEPTATSTPNPTPTPLPSNPTMKQFPILAAALGLAEAKDFNSNAEGAHLQPAHLDALEARLAAAAGFEQAAATATTERNTAQASLATAQGEVTKHKETILDLQGRLLQAPAGTSAPKAGQEKPAEGQDAGAPTVNAWDDLDKAMAAEMANW